MKLYKYCNYSKHLINNLTNNQIYFSPMRELNDPYEGIYDIDIVSDIYEKLCKFVMNDETYDTTKITPEYFKKSAIVNGVNEYFGVTGSSSFSSTIDSLTMWGHYADKQRGVCLEFNSNDTAFQDIRQVRYADNPYVIVFNTMEHCSIDYLLSQLINICFHKSKVWEYEMEWRLLNRAGSFRQYSDSALQRVYFGFYTPLKNVKDIILHTQHIPKISYCLQKISGSRYRLGFEKLPQTMIDNIIEKTNDELEEMSKMEFGISANI